MAVPDLEQELDRLYSLPLAEFIGSRNELVKRLGAAGDRAAADEVKGLAKPSVTAWAVNALYHHERKRFDRLIEAAADVRAALAGRGDRRKADAARRKALRELLGRAAELLGEAGHAATPANRQRISHTLEALAARDPAAPGPRAGRLAGDLEPQGFDVLAGLAASLAPPPAASAARAPAKKAGGKKQAVAARDEARDRRLDEARRKLEEHEAALEGLEREAETAAAAAAGADERQQRLIEEAAEAERRAREAAAAVAEAKKRTAAAKAALTKAEAARRKGLSRLTTARRRLERLES